MAHTPSFSDIKPTDLPAPPKEAIGVVRACSDPNVNNKQLGEIVARNPVLTAELLRISNSPYFGLARKVNSAVHAVSILGHRALRNLVLCVAMRDALRGDALPGLDLNDYWEDALRRAVSARILAPLAKLDTDVCFTAGLLQDFGLLVMMFVEKDQIVNWPNLSSATPDLRYDMELSLFGTTHDTVGLLLAGEWDLPRELGTTMGYHHTGAPGESSPEEGDMVKVAQCADWMAAVFSSDNKGTAVQQCRKILNVHFGLDPKQCEELLEQTAMEMEEAAKALGLKIDTQLQFEEIMRDANLRLVEENLSYQELTWRLEQALTDRDRYAEELQRELELAREVQRSLLPAKLENFPYVSGLNLSAKEVSGDFYDYFPLPNGDLYFCLADVSGKGMNAALLMAKTSSLFHCLGKGLNDPAKLAAMLNREILESTTRGMFVTMIIGVFSPTSGDVLMVNAGHLPALLVDKTGAVRWFSAQAPPLGIMPDIEFPTTHFKLDNNGLYLFTDGLIEAKNKAGNPLELEGLQQLICGRKHLQTDQLIRTILNEVRARAERVEDDLTLLVIEHHTDHG